MAGEQSWDDLSPDAKNENLDKRFRRMLDAVTVAFAQQDAKIEQLRKRVEKLEATGPSEGRS
ncbi:MAG: hypothetical protein ACLQJR_16285 [Stellaceae bacterium]